METNDICRFSVYICGFIKFSEREIDKSLLKSTFRSSRLNYELFTVNNDLYISVVNVRYQVIVSLTNRKRNEEKHYFSEKIAVYT